MEETNPTQDNGPDAAAPLSNGETAATGQTKNPPAPETAQASDAASEALDAAGESQDTGEAPPPPSRSASDLPLTRQEQVGLLLGANLVTLIVAVILTLCILSLVNNGLSFTSSSQLKQEMDALKTQASALQQGITDLSTRLEKMDSASGKLSTMESESQSLRADLSARSKEILDLQEQMSNLSNRVKSLEARTLSFEKFLEGLRALLNGSN